MLIRGAVLFTLLALSGCTDMMSALAAVKVDKVEYKGWHNCYRVSNGEIEAIVTGDVGPRVIRFGFVGGQNMFKEFAEQLGKSGESAFQLRGGSRVWKAPEDPVATWAPDNVPVDLKVTPTGLIARAPVEPLTKLQKEIEISLARARSRRCPYRACRRPHGSRRLRPRDISLMPRRTCPGSC